MSFGPRIKTLTPADLSQFLARTPKPTPIIVRDVNYSRVPRKLRDLVHAMEQRLLAVEGALAEERKLVAALESRINGA